MSRFNTQAQDDTITENLAGGKAWKVTPEYELASILLTSFVKDQFYRSANDTVKRLKHLIRKCDPEFVAKAIVFARTVFGMRTISHVAAAELSEFIKGKEWAKDFYARVIYRPDDMLEILAYLKATGRVRGNGKGVKISHAIRKGIAKAFEKFDSYSLAKYRGEGKDFSLVDVVNMVRPIPVERNAEALKKLIEGDLTSTETWEAMLSKAGADAETEEEKDNLKKEAWEKLIKEKKIKYFALLKNLRNIMEQAPEVVAEACSMLVDKRAIGKSLVLPFRYLTAYNEIQKLQNDKLSRQVMGAINDAVDISLQNVPKFEGETLVVIDRSASMDSAVAGGKTSMAMIAELFASIMGKANNADIMIFGTYAKYVPFNPSDSTLTVTNQIDGYNRRSDGSYSGEQQGTFNVGHGTNFNEIFREANKKYDRIIIFSDCQGWEEGGDPSFEQRAYEKKFGVKPYIYSIDLAGYGQMMFPAHKTFAVAGYSDKIFNIMQMFEKDKDAFLNEILKTKL